MSIDEHAIDETLQFIGNQQIEDRCLLFLFWNEERIKDEEKEVSFPKQAILEMFQLCGGRRIPSTTVCCISFGSPILMIGCRREMKHHLPWSFSVGPDTARFLGIRSRPPIAEVVVVFIPCKGIPELEVLDFFLLN
jgi:hypothetical protein